MWWIVALVVLIMLMAFVAWRQRKRSGDRFMTQQDLHRQNSKSEHGGFTGSGGGATG